MMSVIVVVDIYQNKVTDPSYELLALGKEVASGLGVPLKALLIGSGLSNYTSDMGLANELILVEDASLANFTGDVWIQVVTGVAKKHNAKVVLTASSARSYDFSAQVAVKLDATHSGYCRNVVVDGGKVNTTNLLYGGKVVLKTAGSGKPCVIDCAPGVRKQEAGKVQGSPIAVSEKLADFFTGSKVHFKAMHIPETTDVDITVQKVLVSVGRGIQDKENIEMAEELAQALGGVVSASRPIIDSGWLPKSRQVGKSGKTVKPKLYLMLGISGAPEHIEGMSLAELVVAVNTDEKAPIFNIAHYGIVADILDFMPELTDKLK